MHDRYENETHEGVPTMAEMKETQSDIDKLLEERQSTHGDFTDHAQTTQNLKAMIRSGLAALDKYLPNAQVESLDMICHKIGRIVAGDADFRDHWDDIAGYAKLAANRCSK